MNTNMTNLDRRLRLLLIAPRGGDRDPDRPRVAGLDRPVRARRDPARY